MQRTEIAFMGLREVLKVSIRFWATLAVVTVVLIVIASVIWILDHPYGISWDEAGYFNRVLLDSKRVEQGGSKFFGGGFIYFAGSMLLEERYRPPAYRLLAGPFIYLFGFTPVSVRLLSIGFLMVSLILVYLTGRSVAGSAAGAFAVIFLSLCPDVIFASMFFGTEYPLYLATAGVLYFLFLNWDKDGGSFWRWLGLGISLGLGALAKTSFLLIGPPVWLISFVLSWRRIMAGPNPKSLLKAAVLGIVIGLPWWALNFSHTEEFTRSAFNFIRGTLGPSSLATWGKWLVLFAQNGLGLPLSVLLALVLISLLILRTNKLGTTIDRKEKACLMVCFIGAMPLILAQFPKMNLHIRHMAPSFILLAVGLGIVAERTQWTTKGAFRTTAGILFVVQLLMIFIPGIQRTIFPLDPPFINGRPPWMVMGRIEQWDWSPLREICRSYGIDKPTISFLGGARCFTPPHIEYPWIKQNEKVQVNWLWRLEDGKIDWNKIMKDIDDSDIVLTAPKYVGDSIPKDDRLDNQYNSEFAKVLESDARFKGPIRLCMGRFEPTEIVVFVKKSRLNGSQH